jgi:hydrogenase/urease accessory protein HupE
MNIKLNWDGVGIATSVACAIHCAVLPMIIPSLPLLGVNLIHNQFFEWAMIMLAFLVGGYALFHGYFKHHQYIYPVLVFLLGFSFLVAKQFIPQREYLFLGIAVCLIVSAHYWNYKLCHRSKCNSPHHKH